KKSNRSFGLGLIQNFILVDELKAYYPVSILCNVFDIHRSSYKYWAKRLLFNFLLIILEIFVTFNGECF
ncbi:hypothetical protein UB37_17120, partial [Photobacterium iliopiscarium]